MTLKLDTDTLTIHKHPTNAGDCMNDPTHKRRQRSPLWRAPVALAFSAAFLGFSGCTQFGGTGQPLSANQPQQPFVTQHSQVGQTQPAALASSPAGQSISTVSPTYAAGPPNAVSTAPAVPPVYAGSPATSVSGSAIAQVAHTAPATDPNRYAARQYPTGPTVDGYAPGSAVTSVPGALGDPYGAVDPYNVFQGPRERTADLVLSGYPARTGRIMLGGAVNSDAGVTGQLTIDEKNFDICRWPTSFQDLFSGTAFRGRGQTLRLEAAPGSQFQRYMATFVEPSIFNRPISMSVNGFLYDRRFDDWDEQRLGGRVGLGYRITPDLSVSVSAGGQNVNIRNPSVPTPQQLTDVLGDNALYSGEVSLKHDTRNSPILASRGHFFDFSFEQAFGDFNYANFELGFRQYWTLAERADGSGKQTLSYSTQAGFSGEETPVFENYFAGGYATIRGFEFRGASPVDVPTGVEVGGRFQFLNSVEYMFPITADDAFRGVAFVDFGTVEQNIEINADQFRVAPGLGLRVAIPMLGPAPLAFDFAYPIAKADTDQTRLFSFYMSAVR